MKQIYKLDGLNYYIFGGDKVIADEENVPNGYTSIKPEIIPGVGMYKPKLENGHVVEGATPQEIENIKNPLVPPQPKTEIETLREENAQLNLAIIELWEIIG